jgi:hypothetical protein
MWQVNPGLLCNKHLLGEHGEIHKHRHNFEKKHNMTGRMKYPSQIDPHAQGARHDVLAAEMLKRSMNHKSPYVQPDTSYLPSAQIDTEYNLNDLANRCPDCRARIEESRNDG